jgi:hypothetical protein
MVRSLKQVDNFAPCIYPRAAVGHHRHVEYPACGTLAIGRSEVTVEVTVGWTPEMVILRLLYKPFAIIAALIASRIGRSVFRSLWSKIDAEPPPKPGTGEGSMAKVVGGQALEAGVMAGVAAAVDRGFARVFHHLIGIWPKKRPQPEPADD